MQVVQKKEEREGVCVCVCVRDKHRHTERGTVIKEGCTGVLDTTDDT